MKQLTNYQTFGKDSAPTIYYLLGNGGRTRLYSPHIKLLALFGYRIVAIEYVADVLAAGEPKRLLRVLEEIIELVKEDMSKYKVAGIYGVSLGTVFGLNLITQTGIYKALFNTGPADLTDVIWDAVGLTPIKDSYKKNGYTRQDLKNAWQNIDVPANATNLKGTKILCMSSKEDEIITFDNYQVAEQLIIDGGANVRRITAKRYGHVSVIIRNMLRLRTTINFFR